MFIVYFLSVLNQLTNIKLFTQLSYVIMIFISLFCFKFLFYQGANRLLKGFLFIYLIVLLLIGYLRQNWISYYLLDFTNFFFLLILLIPFNNETLKYIATNLPKKMASLLYIGLPLSWYFILKIGLNPGSEIERVSGNLDAVSFDLISTYKLVDFSVLLFPFLPMFSTIKKMVVILSLTTFFLVSFFTATRGGVFTCILSLLLTVYIYRRQVFTVSRIVKIFGLILIIILIIGNFFGFEKIDDNVNYFFNRLDTKNENFTTYREKEGDDFFKYSSFNEIIFGRGLGGAHSFGIWGEREGLNLKYGMNMTHYGYLYLILKGGIVLLFLIYGMAIYAMIKLWKYGEEFKPFSIIIFLYLFYEISIPKFYDPFYLFLFLITIYLSLNLTKHQNKMAYLIKK